MGMSAIDEIKAERLRQMEIEGWSTAHDDRHTDKSLALAAALYAAPIPLKELVLAHDGDSYQARTRDPWPWTGVSVNGSYNCWDKRHKHDYRRRLVIAGALIAAEIDRLDRKGKK